MAETSRPEDTGHPVVNTTRARQGRYGKPVFWVLVVSTLLAAIGMFAAWGWKAPGLARPGSQQTVTSPSAAQTMHAPDPAPIQQPVGTDHTAPGPGVTPQ